MSVPAIVEAGSDAYVETTFIATVHAPAATSTAVTFTLSEPDGTVTTVNSPNVAITGPTSGTDTVDGVTVTTTTWVWKTPVLDQAGRHAVESHSTAGIVAAKRSVIVVPSFEPFLTP